MMTPHARRAASERLDQLAPRHPLHRVSVTAASLFAIIWLALYIIAGPTELVRRVKLKCVTPPREVISPRAFNSRRDINPERSQSDAAARPQSAQTQTWDLISWDLSQDSGAHDRGIDPIQGEVIPLITRARRDAAQRGRPLAIHLQGVNRSALAKLEAEMMRRGGCWASARLVNTPRWVRWLSARGLDVSAILVGPDRAASLSDERALWTGVWGAPQSASAVITAERWALPAPPGRWPSRWFQPQPAALAVTISSGDAVHDAIGGVVERLQLVNIQLPSAYHKHQSGALGLRALRQPPLSTRSGDRWLIMGDWRVQPRALEAHPSAGFRFQRFSIEALYRDSALTLRPTPQDTAGLWGRWRSEGALDHPAIIDYALGSSGAIELHQLPRRDELWIGERVQRAPLKVSWRPAQ